MINAKTLLMVPKSIKSPKNSESDKDSNKNRSFSDKVRILFNRI